jgi:glycosyltransferase involved in cell wall biosynthesis
MESYLEDLNRSLLERSAATIVQLQLTSDPRRVGEESIALGRGRFVRVSLFVSQAAHEAAIRGDPAPGPGRRLNAWRDRVLASTWVHPWLTRPLVRGRRVPRRIGEPDGLPALLQSLHQRMPADLVCLHSAGGADAGEVLAFGRATGVPVGYVHHFANERLASPAMIGQLQDLPAIGGVCAAGLPGYLRSRFHVVADGVDTGFFTAPETAPDAMGDPILFLPARLTPAKGQAEVVRIAGALLRQGLPTRVVLAGRADSPGFAQELTRLAAAEGLGDRVVLPGPLDAAGLRAAYARAAVVVFPTRHHEGLPRVLLEAQAMGVPAVVHRIGGTAEGVVEGRTGFVLPPGDFAGLVTAVARLLRDPALRQACSVAGRQLARAKFSLEALAGRHEAFCTALLGGTAR